MIRLANRNRTSRPDNIILGLTLTLVGIGLVMVYSAGAPQSDSPYHYLQKQLLWVVIGVALMIVISRLNLKALDETWFVGLLLAAAFVMLTLVYIPGLAAPSKARTAGSTWARPSSNPRNSPRARWCFSSRITCRGAGRRSGSSWPGCCRWSAARWCSWG